MQLADPAGPSAAIVTIDPANGKIRAMASSGTYQDSKFNLAAQGHRQPGSAFKTFVLTAAIRAGMDPDSTYYTSKPLDIDDPDYGHWEVQTFGNSYIGTVSLTSATLSSDNTVYAQLILDLGPKKVCETAKLLGITSHLDCYAAEGLGGLTLGVTPLEMAGAYATLASGGIRHRPTGIERVVFPDGKSEDLGKPEGKRVLTDGQAYAVTKMLKANVLGGTGTAARSAARRPGRPARPTRPRTPGSSATPRSSRPPCGSAIRTRRCRWRPRASAAWRRHLAGACLARLHVDPRTATTATTSRRPPSPPSSLRSSASTRARARPDTGEYYGRRDGTTDARPEVRPALLRGRAARRAADRDAARARPRPRRPLRQWERERERERQREWRRRHRRARLIPGSWASST